MTMSFIYQQPKKVFELWMKLDTINFRWKLTYCTVLLQKIIIQIAMYWNRFKKLRSNIDFEFIYQPPKKVFEFWFQLNIINFYLKLIIIPLTKSDLTCCSNSKHHWWDDVKYYSNPVCLADKCNYVSHCIVQKKNETDVPLIWSWLQVHIFWVVT